MGKKIDKKKPVTKKSVINAWSGALGGVIFWIILGAFLFHWEWFVFLLIAFTISNPLQLTIRYFGAERSICPKCGLEIEPDVPFCKGCGTKIVSECPHCNVKVYGTAKFCESCGKPIYNELPKILSTSTQSLPPKLLSDVRSTSSVTGVKYCPMCGSQITPNISVCPYCQSKLN